MQHALPDAADLPAAVSHQLQAQALPDCRPLALGTAPLLQLHAPVRAQGPLLAPGGLPPCSPTCEGDAGDLQRPFLTALNSGSTGMHPPCGEHVDRCGLAGARPTSLLGWPSSLGREHPFAPRHDGCLCSQLVRAGCIYLQALLKGVGTCERHVQLERVTKPKPFLSSQPATEGGQGLCQGPCQDPCQSPRQGLDSKGHAPAEEPPDHERGVHQAQDKQATKDDDVVGQHRLHTRTF